jgi:PAS domain-containing protein
VPRAREALLDTMTDAVVILDVADRVVFANAPAVNLFGLPEAADRLPAAMRLPDHHTSAVSWMSEQTLDSLPGGRRWIDVRANPLVDRWGDYAGRLVVARDISPRKALEAERERLIEELRGSRDTVLRLTAVLTLCTHCHRLRSDDGEWTELEVFLQQHAVDVSHGMCADCYRRTYGEDPSR